jgi:hypothetical protein
MDVERAYCLPSIPLEAGIEASGRKSVLLMGKAEEAAQKSADATSMSVAIAVARQRLLDAHFTHVLELIQRAQGEVAAPQALTIYSRIHRLTEIDIQALRNRVLVHLGRVAATDVTDLPHTFVAIDGAVEWDITASLVERIRKRLGGRRNYELRDWIDQHSGHVECDLMKLHVENLLALGEVMGADAKPVDVTRTYMREAVVRDELWEPLYWGYLDRQYDRVLAATSPPAREAEAERLVPAARISRAAEKQTGTG